MNEVARERRLKSIREEKHWHDMALHGGMVNMTPEQKTG